MRKQAEKIKSGLDYVEAMIAKNEKIMSKAEQAARSAKGRAVAARTKAAKEKAYAFELKNRSKILLFYSGEGWYKMGGNSALIYLHLLAPKFGLNPKLKPDRDFYHKFPDGIISIRDLEAVKTTFAAHKIKLVAEDDDLIVFDLVGA